MNSNQSSQGFPNNLLKPIRELLRQELFRLKRTRKDLAAGDPFTDEGRAGQNSLEEDVDEQIGHLDTEVKVKFVDKQIVQFRKALTRLKIGKYGVCEKCGRMIDTDRLAVRPETTICIDCEKENE